MAGDPPFFVDNPGGALTGAVLEFPDLTATDVEVADDGVVVASRPTINFISGTGITVTGADDAINDEIDVTFALSAAAATQAELDVVAASVTTLSGDVDTALAVLDAVDADLQAQMFTVVDNPQTASYELVANDAGKQISMNVAGANTLTVPANATVAFPVNTVIHVYQYGAGTTTIVAAGGVTIRSFGPSLVSGGQYALMSLRKRATNEWELTGLTA
jgi:hypothetical protein